MEQKINKRILAHINEDHLNSLYLKEGAVTDERKVEIREQVMNEIRKFVRCESEDNLLFTYDFTKADGETVSTWWLEDIGCEDDDDVLTEQAACAEYQKRSKLSGDLADQLAWAMIVLLTGQVIGGSKYTEFYVLGGVALLYLLLSTLQYVWQAVTTWIVMCRIKRTGITPSDYPNWLGFGAWVFYGLKTITITSGAVYGIYHFLWWLF